MAKTVDVVLGDDKFTIGAMNLGQIEDAMPTIVAIRAGDPSAQFGKLLDVLQIALREAYPGTNVRKLTCGIADLRAAFADAMTISGFEMKATPSGEAPARANSTSEPSEAA